MFRKVGEDEREGNAPLDGKPETDADKRFFDLRESGYTGPIDQDGNIADSANHHQRKEHPWPGTTGRHSGPGFADHTFAECRRSCAENNAEH